MVSLLVSTLTPLTVWADPHTIEGTGTEEDPYIVKTAFDLTNMRDNPNAHYKLGGNIDLSIFPNWTPIPQFWGSLDGDGYAISGLKSIHPTESNIGLFGEIGMDATVANFDLVDVEVEGKDSVGGVAGYINGAYIRDVHVTGKITGTNQTGGIVGMSFGYVFDSSFNGEVTGGMDTGGLVGRNVFTIIGSYAIVQVTSDTGDHTGGIVGFNGGHIQESYAEGEVSGNGNNIGGLVGNNQTGSIFDSYAQVAVSTVSGNNVGGLTGRNDTRHVIRSYAVGPVSGPASSSGGLIGSYVSGMVQNSYYDEETTGQSDSGKGDGRSTAQMQMESNYEQWDFNEVWTIKDGEAYPKLRRIKGDTPVEAQQYTVSYEGNEHTSGGVPPAQTFAEGAQATVALAVSLFRTGHLFAGWNTEPDGSGISYAEGDEFTMGAADVTLYAQWKPVLKGDVNGDGFVTPADAFILTQAMEGKITLMGDEHSILDMNDDGFLTNQDLVMLLEAYQSTPAPAAQFAWESVTVEIGQMSGLPGELVSVPLVLKGTTAEVAAYGIELEYDGGALYVDDVLGHGASLVANEKIGLMQLAWVDRTGGASPKTAGDTLLTLVFQIREDAEPGSRTITVKQAQNGGNLHFQSEANDAMSVQVINGRLDVLEEAQPLLTAIPGPNSAKLSWTPWPDAIGYTIYYGIDEDHLIGSEYAEKVKVTGTSHTLQDLHNGTTYYIVIEPKLSSGKKVSSNITRVMPDSTDVNSLQDILDGIYAQIDGLPEGNSKDELMDTADDYQDEIEKLRELESKVDDLPSYTILYQEMTQLGKALFELQINVLLTYFDQLSDALALLEGENADLKAEAQDLKQKLEELEDKVQELENGNANLSQQLQSLNQTVTDLQGQITDLNETIQNLKNENDQLKQEKAALQAEIDTLEEQIEELEAKVEELEGDKNALQAIIDALHSQVDALKEELEELKGDGADLAQQLANVKAQVSELQTALGQAEAFTADLLALQIGYADGDSAERVTRSFTLPVTGTGGTDIVWNTSHDGYVTIMDGTAQVNRPTYSEGDAFVTLTATLTLGELTGTVSQLIRIVKAEPTDAEAVVLAEKELTIQFAEGDSIQGVTRQLGLTDHGLHGAEIVWTSSHPELISDTGAVTRPAHDQTSAWVTLTAHITRGEAAETKLFVVQVLKMVQTAAEAVEAAKAALTLELAPGDEPTAVRGPIPLPLTGTDGTTVTWSSSDETIIGADGAVTRPTAAQGNQMVTLTATIVKDGVTDVKTFDVTVLAFASGKPVELVTQGTGLGIVRDRSGIRVTIEASRRDTAHQPDKAVVVFQLMRDNESMAIVAFEKEQLLSERATAGFFSVNGNDSRYRVKVYVYDDLTTDEATIQISLAEAAELR
ncbi:immunoglobulin-like domain-containing protein [Paenibacillus sp. 598K]|uniref:immunoglobulin-like domain-containing protein n=1 Tax=Paenibacillus sp. 598K TaxID=1117987 RepID=UPI001627AED1|nr:immunoglobulin-like domain-containing protein [Paenibacillus sp. 598K]